MQSGYQMKTCFAKQRAVLVLPSALLTLLTSCGDTTAVAPVTTPRTAQCSGVSTNVRSLAPMEGVVLSGTEIECIALAGDGREYLVIPQLTGVTLPYGGYGFRISDPTATGTVARTLELPSRADVNLRSGSPADTLLPAPPVTAQERLDGLMRRREARYRGQTATPRAAVSLSIAAAAPEALRTFSVLNTLAEVPAYSRVAAQLRYAGSRVLVYVDTLSSSAFTDAELTGMGALYDAQLVPAVTRTFGAGSDIDGNGRLIFLLTPTVNALIPASNCAVSGFVRGFFYSYDLSNAGSTSNRGEIFYGYVPDPAGRWSCAQTKADVISNLPPTFIHELQHMVSFGEHAVKRGGDAEEAWLNEGLSHLAEEIGSLTYEARFPAPSGRTVASQIFPDSASPYITPNLLYSYRYLFSSGIYSITTCAPGTFCSLSERGGIWLLLRYLTDREGDGVLRRLVETKLTGRANLESVAGRSTGALLGDFAMAVSADSVIGVSRTATPASLRFSTRNLRRLYKGLFDLYGITRGVSRPFPIEPLTLAPGGNVTGTMRPGTFLTYRLRVPAGTASAVLRLVSTDGNAFPASSGAQVSVLRMP